MALKLDNHDPRIRYMELMLERSTLDEIPLLPLPEGYSFVPYQPGDRDAWIAIERSARELDSYAQGVWVWNRYFGARNAELTQRMVFIQNAAGEKVATATAYYDVRLRDQSGAGWLHWVAVRREDQGKGLSKPLIAHTLRRMHDLGYTHAKIPTQTNTWLACRIYLDFGFVPIPKNAVRCRDGWRFIRTLTGHPALAAFEPIDPCLFLTGDMKGDPQ